MSCRYLMISSGAAIQKWLNSVYLSPYWWLIEYWMTAVLVHAYLYYILNRFPWVTLKATNSNYRAGCDYLWLTLITFYYLNGFLCPSITLITLNGKSLPIKEMVPYNRHDPENLISTWWNKIFKIVTISSNWYKIFLFTRK